MADYRRRLAKRLEYEREMRSLSREALAARAGVSEKTIKRIEEETVDNPRPVTIRRLAEGLEIEPDRLRRPAELEEDQLERVEQMLKRLLDHFDIQELEELADDEDQEPGEEPEQTEQPPG